MSGEENTSPAGPVAKSEILEIPQYVQGKSALPGNDSAIKLSSNESSFGPSPKAIEAYKDMAAHLHRYPDGSQYELREAIADAYSLDANKIICGNGSDEILDMVYRSYLGRDDEVILSTNHFVMCSLYARMQAAKIRFAKENSFKTDVEDLLSLVNDKTRMVTIANPNNPTGTYLTSEEIRQIHAGLPSNVLFVIDGAYAEYPVEDDYDCGSKLVEEFDNVIVTRTFSKIYGLAALRIGWAYCPDSVIDVLQRIRSPFNTTSPSMAAAVAAVKDPQHIEKVRQHTAAWLKKIRTALEELGIEVVPSASNFYLLNFKNCEGKTSAEAASYLENNGVIPRPQGPAGDEDILRITVGLDEENEAVLKILKAYMSE